MFCDYEPARIVQFDGKEMKGIEHYMAASGFHVIRLHYTADPQKDPDTQDGAKWFETAPIGYRGGIASSAWRREMEIDWDATGGELVFPQLDPYKSKIVVNPFEIPETWNLYGSFDYGHRNPSSFHVYAIDHDRNIWSVWEYYMAGKGCRQIAKALRSCPHFDKLDHLPIADPSIWAKTQQTDEGNEMKSIAQLFFELPPAEQIVFSPGKKGGDVTVAEKINGDLWFIPEKPEPEWKFEPKLFLFKTCPMQIWELSKSRYADWSASMSEQRNKKESIVDKDNHAFDDLKMFITMFFMAPTQTPPDDLEPLKKIDPASYAEWMSVRRMHGEEVDSRARLGEFEDDFGDDD